MEFVYQARNSQGESLDGQIVADTLDAATQKLRSDGLYIISISAAAAAKAGGLADMVLFQPRIKREEIIHLATQLAVLTDTGVTLSTALNGIAEQSDNPTFATLVAGIRDEVEAGEDFSKALAKHPKYFDQVFVQLVRASEASGSLGQMLERVASYTRKQLETRQKVKSAMAYPMVMLLMAIGVSVFLLAYVFPKFAPMFASRGLALPAPTRLMMAISGVMTDYWYLLLAGVALLVGGTVLGLRTGPGRRIWHYVQIHMPVIGPMFRKASLTRSLRTMATMVNSGVPMLEALELSGKVAGNVHYRDLWEHVGEKVVGGQQICDAIGDDPLMPSILVQMISAGEQSGKLGPVLERVSDFYDQDLETAIKAATSIIEPIMVGVMGVVIGAVAMSLLLPIFTLSRQSG